MMQAPSAADTAAMTMLTRLDHLVRSSRIYPDSHATLQHASHAIGDHFAVILQGRPALDVHVIDDRLLIENRLLKPSPGIRGAIRELGTFWSLRGLGGITIGQHATEAEILPFVRVLLEFPGDGGPGPAAINRELAGRGVRHLQVVGPRSALGAEDIGGAADPATTALRLYLRALRCAAVLQAATISPALRVGMRHLAHEVVELYLSAPRRALALVRPKELVPHHLTHPLHTAVYAVAAGQALGFDQGALEELVVCALALAAGLEPEDDEDEDPRGRPPRVGDYATATRPMDVVEGIDHARAIRVMLGDHDLQPQARRLLRTLFEHDLGCDGEGPPATLRWGDQHPYTPLLCASAELDQLRCGFRTGRKRAPPQALQQMREEAGRFHPDVLAALESLLPELEVISAYV